MLFVLRLSTGDAIITVAQDEESARLQTGTLKLEDGEFIASVRPLSSFAVRVSPSEHGDLEVHSWDGSTLEDILVNEYPLFNEALHAANSVRFMPAPDANRPVMEEFREAHQKNAEILRKGIQEEAQRLSRDSMLARQKTASKLVVLLRCGACRLRYR